MPQFFENRHVSYLCSNPPAVPVPVRNSIYGIRLSLHLVELLQLHEKSVQYEIPKTGDIPSRGCGAIYPLTSNPQGLQVHPVKQAGLHWNRIT